MILLVKEGLVNIWDRLGVLSVAILVVLLTFLAGGGIYYIIHPVEFGGYYLSHDDREYTVNIYWKYGYNSIAYRTYNGQEALDVFNKLNGSYPKGKDDVKIK